MGARTGLAVAATTMAALAGRYTLARRTQDRQTTAELDLRLTDLGTVERVSVLPLVERHAGKPDLRGEAGVSYLVTAGDTTLLFDTGLGAGGGPTVLESNAHALGVSWNDLDALVISHLHLDHVGGPAAQLRRTFRIGPRAELPRSLPAYLPTAMTHRVADVCVTDRVRVIAPGVAVLPPLPRTLFWLGPVVEQALIVNVRDRGLVLITGCGHPPIERTLAAAERVVQAPVHAVIGGLHLPLHPGGTPLLPQAVLGNPNWPWRPINEADARAVLQAIRQHGPALVALSGHDSTPWTLDSFADVLGEAYRTLRVGEAITVEAPRSA